MITCEFSQSKVTIQKIHMKHFYTNLKSYRMSTDTLKNIINYWDTTDDYSLQ